MEDSMLSWFYEVRVLLFAAFEIRSFGVDLYPCSLLCKVPALTRLLSLPHPPTLPLLPLASPTPIPASFIPPSLLFIPSPSHLHPVRPPFFLPV